MARARLRTSQTSWTSGELDPELEGRIDQERYFKGAATIENMRLRPLGGVRRRPGTTYVAAAKTSTMGVQMAPFIARANVAYALEFGEVSGSGYIRFYRNNGQILSSPELVTNGAFDTSLTGWTRTGTTAATAGTASLTALGETIVNGGFLTNLSSWSPSNGAAWQSPGLANLPTAISQITQTATVAAGSSYSFTMTVVSGTAHLTIGALLDVFIPTGTFNYTITPSTTSLAITIKGVAQVDDIRMKLQSSIRQSATVAAGTTYTLRFRVVSASAAVPVAIGSTTGGADLLDVALPVGTYTYPIVSPTSVVSIRFASGALVGTSEIDDVSLKLAVATPHEIASPYLVGDLPNIRWAPSADVLYIACEGYAPRKLSRTSDVDWTLTTVNFRPPATEEKPLTFAGVTLTLGAVTGTGITATASGGSPFLNGDVDRQIRSGIGRAIIKSFSSSTVVTLDIIDDFTTTVLAPGTWTLNGSPTATLTPDKAGPKGAVVTLTATTLNVFRSSDVGKYVRIQNGLVRITKFTSGTVVTGEILHGLAAATGTGAWSLEVASWDDTDGWPVDVGFTSGDRLVWARDDRIWASVVGDYENMSPGTLDDDAFTLAMRTSEVSEIRGIVGATDLQLFSSGAEFVVTGGTDQPITPTNFKISSDTTYGAGRNRVIRVNGQVIYVDRSGRGLREQVFSIEVNRYVAVDLLQLAQHLFPIGTRITDLGYQRSPDSIIWALRSDGVLCGLTYLRPEGVVGWWRMITDGFIRSFCVIPHPDGDREQVWLAVDRVIGGNTVTYIERIDDSSVLSFPSGESFGQKGTDSSLSYNGPAIQVLAGLGHLEGRTVDVMVNDAPPLGAKDLGQFEVSGGQIDLGASYTQIELGLHYEGTLVTVRPEVQVQGTSQMVKKRNAQIGVRVYRTVRLKANGNLLPITGQVLTGDVRGVNLGWDRDGRVTLTSDRPWPATILMLTNILGVGA